MSSSLTTSIFCLMVSRARDAPSLPPIVFERLLVDCPDPGPSGEPFLRLPFFVEALAADAVHFVVANHAAAGTVKPPATCPLATVAITAFWRRGLHQAQFTFRTRHAVPLRWKVCTSTYSMQQYCTALYCTPTGAWLVRGKACVSVSGTGTVEGIEPFKPALLRGSFQ